MAGTTRGPAPLGGKLPPQPLGEALLADVDAWAESRGVKRAQAVRALLALALDVTPTRPPDTPRRAALAARRAQLIRELAEIDVQLDLEPSRPRRTLTAYLWHRADYARVQQHYNQ